MSWERLPFATTPILVADDIAKQRQNVSALKFCLGPPYRLEPFSTSLLPSGRQMAFNQSLKTWTWTKPPLFTYIYSYYAILPC